MSLRILYAHLGLVEPGTAATDRDGDVWCVWPDGSVGNHEPLVPGEDASAVAVVTAMFGPFDVLATGLSLHDCDEIASRSRHGTRVAARAHALKCAGLPAEVGTESIDGPNGLRHHARLVGGRLGPDGRPAISVGQRVRRRGEPKGLMGLVLEIRGEVAKVAWEGGANHPKSIAVFQLEIVR